MGKGKRNRQKRRGQAQQRRQTSGLSDHARHKKTLTPPLMTLPNLKPTSWPLDGLPDFIWCQAVREETAHLPAANDALDVLDEFVPEPPSEIGTEEEIAIPADEDRFRPHPVEFLDGRISTFPLVPKERRAEARDALRDRAPWGLPDELGHAFALYPDCPAAWLFEDWFTQNKADPDIGTAYLKRLVEPMIDVRGRPSSQLRMIPIARRITHQKMAFIRSDSMLDLLPRYPTGLNEEEQLEVEQWTRATWQAHWVSSDRSVADAWAKHFWRRNWQVSACDPQLTEPPPPLDEPDEDADQTPSEVGRGQREPTIAEIRRAFLNAIDALGDELREHQHQVEMDIYDPTADEVRLGLASRVFRLLRHFASNPDHWTNTLGPHLLRSMIDARIIIAWLLKQDDAERYQRFKEYGVGKRKLFKLQLEDLMDRDDLGIDDDDEALHKRLETEVNEDVLEEFIRIDVGGSFSGKNIRDMAKETELAELYSLSYQPLSTEAHGEWGSLVAFDLRRCGNPLHRYHRLARFDTPREVVVHLGWLRSAYELAEAAISDIFDSYGLPVEELFDRCLESLTEAKQGLSSTDEHPA
jgi:hypothetical protein